MRREQTGDGKEISFEEALAMIPDREEVGASCVHPKHGAVRTTLPRQEVVDALRDAFGIFLSPIPENIHEFIYGIYARREPGANPVFIEATSR